jgi:hypothetical protein
MRSSRSHQPISIGDITVHQIWSLSNPFFLLGSPAKGNQQGFG